MAPNRYKLYTLIGIGAAAFVVMLGAGRSVGAAVVAALLLVLLIWCLARIREEGRDLRKLFKEFFPRKIPAGRLFEFSGTDEFDTIFRHTIEYRLRGNARVIDPKKFKHVRIDTAYGMNVFVEELNHLVFWPTLEAENCFFLIRLNPNFDGYFCPLLYRAISENGDLRFEIDLNCARIAAIAKAITKEPEKRIHGCEINTLLVDLGVWSRDISERNVAMMPSTIRTALGENKRSAEVEELMAIMLYDKFLELKQRFEERSYSEYPLTVWKKHLPDGVHLRWRCENYATSRVFGYRHEYHDGLPREVKDAHVGGRLIVNSSDADGELIDSVRPGETVYYSFYVEYPETRDLDFFGFKKETMPVRCGFVTFSARLAPEAAPERELLRKVNVSTLQQRLQELEERAAKRKPVTVEERVERGLQTAEARVRLVKALARFERQLVEEIEGDDALPAEEKKAEVADIKDYIAYLKGKLRDEV